jgi:CheY-like chemotaxis protein
MALFPSSHILVRHLNMQPISLIAEDNHPVHYLLKTYAQMCGFQTVQATVGDRVLEMVRQIKPAFILLNIDLPGRLRGWEVLACIKGDEAIRSVPIIVYGLKDGSPDAQQRETADACLPIPVLYESFRGTLTSVGVTFQESKTEPVPGAERRSVRSRKEKKEKPG